MQKSLFSLFIQNIEENIKLQNDSLITQIENCSKNIENVINEHNEQSNRILSEIKLQKDSNVQRIEDICNSLKTYLSNATTEISKFNESLTQHDSEIRETINVFKNVVEGKSDAFPFRIFTFSGRISIWLKKCFHVNEW